ncbi:ankyrin repeat protein [gut metagenome]|uniref:Ankyrin repeat protein n=1 Tax=gut metagenome TaxID=749906 RepID=J9GGN0_9ZZZZ
MIGVGVNPNLMLDSGDTPLTHALRYDDWSTVDVLLKSSLTDVSRKNRMGETPLMLAVFKNRRDYFDQLLQRGAGVNNAGGWTALHYAATNGRTEMLKRLLSLGADVNAQTQAGVTPLHMAARTPYRDCVLLLLKAGAFRDYCTNAGLSPADMARKAGDRELADYLAVERCAVRGLRR